MTGIVYRLVKGTKLTHAEADENFRIGSVRELKAVFPGAVAVMTGKARWYPQEPVTLTSMTLTAGVAPTANSTLALKKNGTQVGTITLTAGSYKVTVDISPDISLAVTDYLTVDVVSVTGGEDFTLCISYNL